MRKKTNGKISSVTTKKFAGNRVFIALRTDIFGVEDEHVTLEYLGNNVEWNYLMDRLDHWNWTLATPLQVQVNGYANWSTPTSFCQVALVHFPDYPSLNGRNWHITIEKSKKPIQNVWQMTEQEYKSRRDICGDIWVGWVTEEGERKWLTSFGVSRMPQESSSPVPF